MPDNALYEIIAAAAAGCIDKANFVQFKDYLDNGGELPEKELGVMQNIVSMIPVILDLETPNPAIKEEVAKKLIGMQDEIKTKIREEKQKTIIDRSATFSKEFTAHQTANRKRQTLTFLESLEPVKTKSSEGPKEAMPPEPKPKTRYTGSIVPEQPQQFYTPQPPQPVQQDKSGSAFAGWIALLLTIILFTILGYYTYSSTSALQDEIEDLKNSVTSLKSELSSANNFMNNYISLIEFFNYKDVTVINLSPADPNEKSSARLLLAFDQKEGLVQFKNARPLQPNQGYQLWVAGRGQSYSMGVYTPTGSEYLRITSFPFLPKEQIETIRVTIESNAGSPTPSVQDYMTGLFQQPGRSR